jgi:putative phosphoesterase
MKLALLGDVHGNHRALTAVLSVASLLGVESLLITGDLVGYYDAPLAVLDMLRSWKHYLVRGNHEDMLKIARSDNDFLSKVDLKYGTGLRSAIEQLTESQLDELCNLPHPLDLEIDGCKILLCHGSPWDNNQYIYPDAKIELLEKCALQEYDLIVLGHSHYPMTHRIGKTLIVNPGSVGQPRNGKPGAHWAIFDTSTHSLEFFNEKYDYLALVSECKRRNPKLPYLADVLKRLN